MGGGGKITSQWSLKANRYTGFSGEADSSPLLEKNNKDHLRLVEGMIHQGDSSFITMCTEHWYSKFLKQTLLNLKVQMDPYAVMEDHFNIPL